MSRPPASLVMALSRVSPVFGRRRRVRVLFQDSPGDPGWCAEDVSGLFQACPAAETPGF